MQLVTLSLGSLAMASFERSNLSNRSNDSESLWFQNFDPTRSSPATTPESGRGRAASPRSSAGSSGAATNVDALSALFSKATLCRVDGEELPADGGLDALLSSLSSLSVGGSGGGGGGGSKSTTTTAATAADQQRAPLYIDVDGDEVAIFDEASLFGAVAACIARGESLEFRSRPRQRKNSSGRAGAKRSHWMDTEDPEEEGGDEGEAAGTDAHSSVSGVSHSRMVAAQTVVECANAAQTNVMAARTAAAAAAAARPRAPAPASYKRRKTSDGSFDAGGDDDDGGGGGGGGSEDYAERTRSLAAKAERRLRPSSAVATKTSSSGRHVVSFESRVDDSYVGMSISADGLIVSKPDLFQQIASGRRVMAKVIDKDGGKSFRPLL